MQAGEVINRTCIEKINLTKEEADLFIERMALQDRVMYYYKCPFCNSYHASKSAHSIKTITIIGGSSGNNGKR